MKKALSVLLTLCLLLFLASGALADNRGTVNYYLDTDKGILYINGSGPMPDFDTEATPWSKQTAFIKKVVIAPGITTIGNQAFEYCHKLESVDIPLSVKRIGDYAFYKCGHLKSVYIPSKVNFIGKYAFNHCQELTSVSIPNGVKVLPECCFNSCFELELVSIPKSVTAIENNAFNGCKKIKSVLFGGSRTQYESLRIEEDNEQLTNARPIISDGNFAVGHIFTQAKEAIWQALPNANIYDGYYDDENQFFVSDPYVDEIVAYFAENPTATGNEAYSYASDLTDIQAKLCDINALYTAYGYKLSVKLLPEAANEIGNGSYADRKDAYDNGYVYAIIVDGCITDSVLHIMSEDLKPYLAPELIESNYPYDGSYSFVNEKSIKKIAEQYL